MSLAWKNLEEEDYFIISGPVLKPVKPSVLLDASIKTCYIELVFLVTGNKKLCYVVHELGVILLLHNDMITL